jgi:hypothetical protein
MPKQSKIIVYLFLVFFINIFLAGGPRAEDSFFNIYDLNVEGQQVDYLIDDLNKDGKNDCLFFHTKKERSISRHFSIFYQTVNGFSSKADQSFEIDPEAIVFDLSDIGAKPGKEIIFFTSTGLFYYEQEQGHYKQTPKTLLKTDSIFKLADRSFMENLDFARDLDGDGIDEIMIPGFNNYLVYRRHINGNYRLESTLDVRMQSSIVSSKEVTPYLISSFVTPNIVIADYNRDQRDDLIIVQDTYIKVFFQDEQGNYSNNNAATVYLGFEITPAYSRKLRNLNPEQRDRLSEKTGIRCLKDINGDGLLDIIIETLSLKGGALNPKRKCSVYFGKEAPGDSRKGAIFRKVPDHVVDHGFQVRTWVVDLNDDKKLDIMVPVVELGLFNIISILFTGYIDVTSYVYLMDATGQYPEEPDTVITFTIEFDRTARREAVVDFEGDYNGDGRIDLLGADQDNLVIHYGPKDGNMSEDPDVVFPVEIPDNGKKVKPAKINADAKSDVVIIYPHIRDNNTVRRNNVRILIAR